MRTAGLLVAMAFVAAAPGAAVGPASAASPSARQEPTGVVALIDTGVNPYHRTFRDDSPRAFRHPSTYIEGYPKSAVALHVSLDEPDFWTAVMKDCERVWSRVESGKLYWFPGTKIVGAATFGPQADVDCSVERPGIAWPGRILDWYGHGTMVASRAASNEYGACPSCRLVSLQMEADETYGTEGAIGAISFAAKNASWIDAQSNSWGPVLPVPDPTGQGGLLTATPELVRAVERTGRRHLSFWASGNGAATRGGGLGHPTLLQPQMTPSVISVGAHDSGYFTAWPGFPPHLVSDGCASWAADNEATDESGETGSGTSSATPFAAGHAVKIAMTARRILGDGSTGVDRGVVASGPRGLVSSGPLEDGKLTLDEWKRLTFVTATARPEAQREDGSPCGPTNGYVLYGPSPVLWSDVPAGYPEFVHIGYGAADAPAFELARDVLSGTTEAPDRTATDAYFERDKAAREALYEVWSRP